MGDRFAGDALTVWRAGFDAAVFSGTAAFGRVGCVRLAVVPVVFGRIDFGAVSFEGVAVAAPRFVARVVPFGAAARDVGTTRAGVSALT